MYGEFQSFRERVVGSRGRGDGIGGGGGGEVGYCEGHEIGEGLDGHDDCVQRVRMTGFGEWIRHSLRIGIPTGGMISIERRWRSDSVYI